METEKGKANLARQGAFFANASVPMLCFATFDFALHLTTYALGLGWNRNAMALILGLYKNPPESTSMSLAMNIHAFLGLTSVALLIFQVLGAIRTPCQTDKRNNIQQRKESFTDTILCKGHKWNGYFVYMVWLTVSLAGAAFSLGSKKFHRGEHTSLINYVVALGTTFGSIFVGTIANMTLGIVSVAHKANKDVLLHRGCMFFAMNWILASALDELIMAVAQTIVYNCNIGPRGYVISAFVGQSFQIVGFLLAAMWYDAALLKYRFVQTNLLFWLLRTMLIGISIFSWKRFDFDTIDGMEVSNDKFCIGHFYGQIG